MSIAVLLLFHALSAIWWGGGGIVAGLFVYPAILAGGPAAAPVLAGMVQRRFSLWMTLASVLSITTGLHLYRLLAQGRPGWVTSPEGLCLGLGGLLALGAAAIGWFRQRPLAGQLGLLAAQVKAAGGQPTPDQAAELMARVHALVRVSRVAAWHLLAAALLMAAHFVAALF